MIDPFTAFIILTAKPVKFKTFLARDVLRSDFNHCRFVDKTIGLLRYITFAHIGTYVFGHLYAKSENLVFVFYNSCFAENDYGFVFVSEFFFDNLVGFYNGKRNPFI